MEKVRPCGRFRQAEPRSACDEHADGHDGERDSEHQGVVVPGLESPVIQQEHDCRDQRQAKVSTVTPCLLLFCFIHVMKIT